MDKDLLNFVETLNELLEEINIPFTEFAEKINCDPHAVNNWKAGKFFPSYESLISLSAYFGKSIDYLFRFSDDSEFKPSENPIPFITRFKNLVSTHKPKLSEYKIAKHCEIQQSTISKWNHERRMPETRTIIKLAKLFDCSIEYLLGRTDKKNFKR